MTPKLSENDLKLLRAATDELATAQNVLGFVQAHIGRVYQLQPGDVITEAGEIERAPRAS